jgi:hypothetical protein
MAMMVPPESDGEHTALASVIMPEETRVAAAASGPEIDLIDYVSRSSYKRRRMPSKPRNPPKPKKKTK